MMIKAILLDCGGVMCRPLGGQWLVPRNLAEILGKPLPEFEPARIARAYERASAYLDEGQLVTTQKHEYKLRLLFTQAMNRELGINLTPAQERDIAFTLTYDDARYQFYDDTRAYLAKWSKEYSVCMLSNAMPSLMRVMQNGGYDAYLDAMLISTFLGVQKPDRRMFAYALREMNLAPCDVLFVDDLKANLMAARAAGLRVARMQRDVYVVPAMPFEEWDGAEATDFESLNQLLKRGEAFL